MLLLGIDVGTSSVKVSVVDGATQKTLASVQHPETERGITSLQAGWAEQDPNTWWEDVQQAIRKLAALRSVPMLDIGAIGISYQMHGLVLLDKNGVPLRDSIIWCDSRAIPYGEKAYKDLGEDYCLGHLLNAPGNFTAAKLAWVQQHEPELFARIDKMMLPGDYIAYRFTGALTTTPSALSEGILWDFKKHGLSSELMQYFGFNENIIPPVQEVFSVHGRLDPGIAAALSLQPGIPVSYKAGDQPNNALSLNVLQAGEVAATAGTSGVIYGVSDTLSFDPESRVNSFAHVNHRKEAARVGVLLCINGTGILNNWVRQLTGGLQSYHEMNELAATAPAGSGGLQVLPFGNGAERMLHNRMTGVSFEGIDLLKHSRAHIFRAAQEGVAFAFRYGLDILKETGMHPSVIRAGHSNMFLSDVFTRAFVNVTGVPVELHTCDGSVGAAIGAGMGVGYFTTPEEAFTGTAAKALVEPVDSAQYNEWYGAWKEKLHLHIASVS